MTTAATSSDGGGDGDGDGRSERLLAAGYPRRTVPTPPSTASPTRGAMQTVAGVMGNVLEWRVLSSLLPLLPHLSSLSCMYSSFSSSPVLLTSSVSLPTIGLRPDPVSLAPPRRHTHPRPVRYDFALFGFFSDVIATVFFPPPSEGDDGEEESTSRLVASFAVYGGAFLMRPVGGLVIGRIGDRHGRKRALVVSLSLMAFPTFLM
jgi:hypothetical protein